MEIGRMSIEEKVARLSEADKAYVRGYVERAVLKFQKQQKGRQAENSPEAEKQETSGALIPERIIEGEEKRKKKEEFNRDDSQGGTRRSQRKTKILR